MIRKSLRKKVGVIVEPLDKRALFSSTFTVANTADSGAGSLRAAIAAASAGDSIDLTGVSGTITLASQLTIDKDLTIVGPGASNLTLSGNNATRVILIDTGLTTAVSGLTIADGVATDFITGGGGIATVQGTMGSLTLDHVDLTGNTSTYAGGGVYGGSVRLTLTDCLFTQNSVTAGDDLAFGGGAAVQDGYLVATNSTFDSNSVTNTTSNIADAYGGGVGIWGVDQGTMAVTNCTFTRNSVTAGSNGWTADAAGGGFYIKATYGGLVMTNCTIVGNSASAPSGPGGGGVDTHVDSGTEVFTNNLIAGNTNNGPDRPDVTLYASNGTTGSYNLIGDGTASTFTNGVDHNQIGSQGNVIDAKLGTFANHGGATPTVSLLSSSPAIDAGLDSGTPVTDQRGYDRRGTADIGAFEFNGIPSQPIVSLTSGLLKVEGTNQNDAIQVWLPKAAPTLVRVLIGGQAWNFSKSLVTAVQVYAEGGNDHVTVNTHVPDTYVFGGGGNDTLIGGAERDILSGGSGNDVITGNEEDDRLNGNGGNDTLFGNGGADRLYGGGGRDLLDGGSGSDYLFGEAGSDVFHARDNTLDWLYGDNSDHGDSAQVDALDVVTGVSNLLA